MRTPVVRVRACVRAWGGGVLRYEDGDEEDLSEGELQDVLLRAAQGGGGGGGDGSDDGDADDDSDGSGDTWTEQEVERRLPTP